MLPAHAVAVLLLAVFAALARRGRRRAVLAASAIGLGGVALRVAAGSDVQLATLPTFAVTIDAGLELLGALLAISAAIAGTRAREMPSSLLAAAAAIFAAWTGVRHAIDAEPVGALGFALAGLVIVELVARRTRDRSTKGRPSHAPSRPDLRWIAAGLAVAGIAVLARNAIVVIGAAIVLSIIGQALLARGAAPRRAPWLPILAIPSLALASYLIVTIAGPTGLSLRLLREGPFSPAAESLLVPLLAAGALPFLGMRPLSGIAPRSLLAPVGVAILARIAAGVFAGGAAAWETVAIPLGVISMCVAAVARDAIAAAAAMAWIASFSIGGAAGAWWLAGAASAGSALGSYGIGRAGPRAVLRVAAAAAGAWGAVAALDAVLRTETLYGLIAWLTLTATVVLALVPARD